MPEAGTRHREIAAGIPGAFWVAAFEHDAAQMEGPKFQQESLLPVFPVGELKRPRDLAA